MSALITTDTRPLRIDCERGGALRTGALSVHQQARRIINQDGWENLARCGGSPLESGLPRCTCSLPIVGQGLRADVFVTINSRVPSKASLEDLPTSRPTPGSSVTTEWASSDRHSGVASR